MQAIAPVTTDQLLQPKWVACFKFSFIDNRIVFLVIKRHGARWSNLIKAQLDIIERLVDLREIVRFQNNWENLIWHYIYVSAFSRYPKEA